MMTKPFNRRRYRQNRQDLHTLLSHMRLFIVKSE